MDSIVNGLYNFVATTVVPTVTQQATNLVGGASVLAGGAAQALTQMSQTALEWSSGSEDTTSSSEVFSWEQQQTPLEPKKEGKDHEAQEKPETSSASSSANTSVDWEVVREDPEETGPVKHNRFEIVQNDYEWMKNSK